MSGTPRAARVALAALVAVALVGGLAGLGLVLRGSAATAPTASGGSPPETAAAAAQGDEREPALPVLEPPGPLAVSENGRFLQHADGRPFTYLGDTAWELFHRLTREQADAYLRDRREKGFTVVQAVALAEQKGLSEPNAYGHLPLVDRDPARPDTGAGEDYWDHVDHVVERAGENGLVVGLLPSWGDKVRRLWGVDGDPVFTEENARAYGRFLGERYADTPNLVWILGGDRGPDEGDVEIWRAMGRGLREGDGGAHLITYHPQGGRTASTAFHDDELFDFMMLQSGHCDGPSQSALMVRRDWRLTPPKPVIDAEPAYEDHPKCHEPDQGWWDEHDARHSAWLATFSGAFGHVYGNHNVWQFYEPGRPGVTAPRTPWSEALDQPGAAQMQHVRALLESRPFFTRVPDQDVLAGDPDAGEGLVRATRASDGSWIGVYTQAGDAFSVDLSALSGATVRSWWYDPRTGRASAPEEFPNPGAVQAFDPPGAPGREGDWVLVLDDAARDLPAPGTA